MKPESLPVEPKAYRRRSQEVLVKVAVIARGSLLPPPFGQCLNLENVTLGVALHQPAKVIHEVAHRHVPVRGLALHRIEISPAVALPHQDQPPIQVNMFLLQAEHLAHSQRAEEADAAANA